MSIFVFFNINFLLYNLKSFQSINKQNDNYNLIESLNIS